MALTGSMRDFGVSEILQLIGHQKKSGVLTVTDQERKVDVLFDQGRIVKAEHAPMEELFDLGATLERSGLVQAETVAAAKAEAQRSLKPLPQVLLSANKINLSDLRLAITLVHQEILCSLFIWKEGDYSFDQGAVTYAGQWTEPIAAEGVLMDGYRVKDEWPLVEKAIPDPHVRLENVAGEFGPESKLNAEQVKVYGLVDGNRTALDVVFLSRMGRFETLKTLRDLIQKGRVKIAGRAALVVEKDVAAGWMRAAALAVLTLGAAAVAMGAFRNAERLFFPDLAAPGVEARERLWTGYKSLRVISALTLYALMEGKYPDTLEVLMERGDLDDDDLHTPWGDLDYKPEADGKSCSLTPPQGPPVGGEDSGSPDPAAGGGGG